MYNVHGVLGFVCCILLRHNRIQTAKMGRAVYRKPDFENNSCSACADFAGGLYTAFILSVFIRVANLGQMIFPE